MLPNPCPLFIWVRWVLKLHITLSFLFVRANKHTIARKKSKQERYNCLTVETETMKHWIQTITRVLRNFHWTGLCYPRNIQTMDLMPHHCTFLHGVKYTLEQDKIAQNKIWLMSAFSNMTCAICFCLVLILYSSPHVSAFCQSCIYLKTQAHWGCVILAFLPQHTWSMAAGYSNIWPLLGWNQESLDALHLQHLWMNICTICMS